MKRLFRLLAPLALVTLTFTACAAQDKPPVDPPAWGAKPLQWDGTGLSVVAFGTSNQASDVFERQQKAEEVAVQRGRLAVAQELARAYTEYARTQRAEQPDQDAIASQLERNMNTIQVRERSYDAARQVAFVLLYVPTYQAEDAIQRLFNLKVRLNEKGQFVTP